ncbi:uncharacterized protein LOC114327300 isoform X7 [Diabrotica virgifera virgifera]|uniref:Endoplasmic reticulum transmembrane protein n=1 Tax=Diabrotica virgifera virgifera TaxID=50390 RepID=A0ABM5JR26_DIAVI|nr:uncharacterized protein LOC114327300 isoform X7 [Diabrotica virgifera virgifera]
MDFILCSLLAIATLYLISAILKHKSYVGVSAKTQLLYTVALVVQGEISILYILLIAFPSIVAFTLAFKMRDTYEKEVDSFWAEILLIAAFILSVYVQPHFSSFGIDLTTESQDFLNKIFGSLEIPTQNPSMFSFSALISSLNHATIENFNKQMNEKYNNFYTHYQSWSILFDKLETLEQDKQKMKKEIGDRQLTELEKKSKIFKSQKNNVNYQISSTQNDMMKIFNNFK